MKQLQPNQSLPPRNGTLDETPDTLAESTVDEFAARTAARLKI
jgi:hypothetical protein